VHVLATVDESTYQGGGMGTDHPVIWSHEQGRGRAWYTALGHTEASWSEQRSWRTSSAASGGRQAPTSLGPTAESSTSVRCFVPDRRRVAAAPDHQLLTSLTVT
jgi:type 1 glutamine amidotransferase